MRYSLIESLAAATINAWDNQTEIITTLILIYVIILTCITIPNSCKVILKLSYIAFTVHVYVFVWFVSAVVPTCLGQRCSCCCCCSVPLTRCGCSDHSINPSWRLHLFHRRSLRQFVRSCDSDTLKQIYVWIFEMFTPGLQYVYACIVTTLVTLWCHRQDQLKDNTCFQCTCCSRESF